MTGLRTSFALTSPDDAWDTVCWHLEATRGLPSVVIIGFESATDEADLRQRAEFLASRRSWPFMLRAAGGFPQWAEATLPVSGVLWLRLVGEPPAVAQAATATLNELRGRLHRPESGVLVVASDWSAVCDMARFAGDFWAVASFVLRVGSPVDLPASAPRDIVPSREPTKNFVFVVPQAYRGPDVAHLLRPLQQALTVLPNDRHAAAQAVATAQGPGAENSSPIKTVLIETVRAAVAGVEDPATVDQAVQRIADALGNIPPDRDLLLLGDTLLRLLVDHCGRAVAAPLVATLLQVARGLHEALGTPEAARDLAVSLLNVAGVGDAAEAEGQVEEAVRLLENVDRIVQTDSSQDDLEQARTTLREIRHHL